MYISMGNFDASVFADACRGLGWMDIAIDVACDNSEYLSQDAERFADILESIDRADLTIVKAHGDRSYFPNFRILFDRISASGSKLFFLSSSQFETDDFRASFPFSDGDYRLLSTLIKVGGVTNYTTVFLWACRMIAGMDVRVPAPVIPAPQGIYPSNRGSSFREDEFLASIDSSKPVVGLLISHMIWREQETRCVDELITALRTRGAQVIPIFFKSIEDPDIRSIGVAGCIRKYFMKGRRSRVDVIVACRGFSQTLMADSAVNNPFRITGVPVIQCPTLYRTADEWRADSFGTSSEELVASIRQTEYDGQISSAPLQFASGRGEARTCSFVRDRIDRIADSAMAWCRLRRVPRADVKVALILNPSSLGGIGAARGLSTLESLRNILAALERNGYGVNFLPKNQNDVLRMLGPIFGQDLSRTGDEGCASAGSVSTDRMARWLEEIPDLARYRILRSVENGASEYGTQIPGIVDGNVFIGVEPGPSSNGEGCNLMHLLGFYRWIEEEFHADALIHLGDHGIAEWLPGKMACLSSECIPDVLIRSMPVIYPFAVDDSGNAVMAKRRLHAVVIGHLVPPEREAGPMRGLEELEALLQGVMASSLYGEARDEASLERIRALIGQLDMWTELSMNPDVSVSELEKSVPSVVDYISFLKRESVSIGLHTFGSPPKGQKLIQSVASALRFRNGDVPALPEVLGAASSGADDISHCISAVSTMAIHKFEPEACITALGWAGVEGADRLMEFVSGTLVPGLKACGNEMTSLMGALEGRFVEPGPAGFPYGGGAHILPTGRNIYADDMRRLPSRIAWTVGCRIADEAVGRYRAKHGRYPESVAIMVNGGNVLGNGGTGLASALWLLGLRPVWGSAGGVVTDLEEVPFEEQGRPRIHVRICMVPNIANLCGGIIRLMELKLGMDRDAGRRCSGIGTTDWSSSGSADVDVIIANRGICSIMSRGSGHVLPADVLGIARRKAGQPDLFLPGCPEGRCVRSIYEDAAFAVRTRLANPLWIEGLMEHGVDGTSQLMMAVEQMGQYVGVDGSTEPWMFRLIADSLVTDSSVSDWIKRTNPATMCEIIQFLSKSSKAGLWRMDASTERLLRSEFLAAEDLMEDQHTDGGGDRHGQHGENFHRYIRPAERYRGTHGGAQADGSFRGRSEVPVPSGVRPSQIQRIHREGCSRNHRGFRSNWLQLAGCLECMRDGIRLH